MANEIQILHDDAAETVYAVLRDRAGQFYDGAGGETFQAAHWANYAVGLTQVEAATSGMVMLQGDWPGADPGFYWLDCYMRAGSSPARTDFHLASLACYWNGSEFSPVAAWSAKTARAGLAVLAGNMTFDEDTGQTSFLDAEDGTTQRASYTVSSTSVGRTAASVS